MPIRQKSGSVNNFSIQNDFKNKFVDENIKYNFAPVHEVKKPQDFITNLPKGLFPVKQDFGPVNNFATSNGFLNNVTSVHERKKFSCSLCCQNFSLNSSLKRHVESFHEGLKFSCSFCGQTCSQRFTVKKHIRVSHGNNPDVKIIQIKTSKSEPTTANAVQNPSLITQIDPGSIIRTNEQQPIENFDAKNWSPIRALAPINFGGSQNITEREIGNLLLGLLPIKQENLS